MGLMDLFQQGDIREKIYTAANRNNVPQGGVTGAAFSALFPHGLGNLAFGREPQATPDLASPEGTQYMADLASNMMVPGTFIGPKGMSNLLGDDVARGLMSGAEAKLAQGVPREEVFRELGVFKGPEGKWRYEIDDSASSINKNRFDRGIGEGIDGEYAILNHNELSRAYPEFSGIDFHRSEGSGSGSFREGIPATDDYFGQSPEIRINASDTEQARSTGLHELQHAVQGREGFAAGGSPEQFVQQKEAEIARDALSWRDDVLKRRAVMPQADIHHISMGVADEYRNAGAEDWIPSREARELATQPGVLFPDKVKGVDGETFDDLRELVQFYGLDKRTTPYTGRELYERLAGEAEARAVQDRMNMNMDQRRASFPEYATRDDLIVRGLMSGVTR